MSEQGWAWRLAVLGRDLSLPLSNSVALGKFLPISEAWWLVSPRKRGTNFCITGPWITKELTSTELVLTGPARC